jgi:hypothetical protein
MGIQIRIPLHKSHIRPHNDNKMPCQVSQLSQDQASDLNFWGPFDPTPDQLQNPVKHQRSIRLTLRCFWNDH